MRQLLEQEHRSGLGFVSGELIGSLWWFAIGGFHVSDRLPHPRASKHTSSEKRRAARGRGSYFDSRLQDTFM